MKEKGLLESIAGNALVQGGISAIGGALGNLPVAPLLQMVPGLMSSYAAQAMEQRLTDALKDAEATIARHGDAIRDLSESQCTLIGAAVGAMYWTMHQGKLDYLKKAVKNALASDEIQTQDSALLNRLVRDISADEIGFLIANFQYTDVYFVVVGTKGPNNEYTRCIEPNSEEMRIATSLISLGLLVPLPVLGLAHYDGSYRFAPVVAKLISLFRSEQSKPVRA